MREVNLAKFDIRTDLIKDIIKENKIDGIEENLFKEDSITISNIYVSEIGAITTTKKSGNYTTIFFKDITDKDNFRKVENYLINELKKIYLKNNIKFNHSCLIIGLGNKSSTPDSLGPRVIDNTLVTNHIYKTIGSLENGYRLTYAFSPGVMANTGIESFDIIESLIEKATPDFVIVVDALASDSLERVNKTIQITDTGISPGSGVGNNRGELSFDTINIPVIAIGIPTVVDASTIVSDTIKFMIKHFSYNISSFDDKKTKLIPSLMRNYLINNNYTLDYNERNYFLGLIGNLSNEEMKSLLKEVLTPIGFNLIVTVKEIDFLIEKLSLLISNSINKSLHEYN